MNSHYSESLFTTGVRVLIPLITAALAAAIVSKAHAQGSLTPSGPPAPLMKSLDQIEPRIPISSLPLTISKPGSYYLTTNLTGLSGQTGIYISCGDVTMDFNGCTLQGVGGSQVDAINVAGSFTNITIRNGHIDGWGGEAINARIYAAGSQDIQVKDMSVSGNGNGGIDVVSGSVINCNSTRNAGSGINLQAGVIVNCNAENNSSVGIYAGSGVVVKSCRSSGNPTLGIYAGPNGRVSDCTAINTTNGTGITLLPGSVAENCSSVSNIYGLYAEAGSMVTDCTVRYATFYGIQADASARLTGSLVQGSGNTGIYLDGTNTVVDGCQVIGYLTGISCTTAAGASGNLIVRNAVRGATTPYNIAVTTMSGPIISYGSGAVAATGVITNTSPWANFSY